MEKIHLHSAGIDIGSRSIYIGVEGKPVRSFGTFTSEFHQAVDYLRENGVLTVAMEATGSYWIILYDILRAAGFDVWLVDGRQTKQVPGRKTDVKDCQWINQLHSFGLLNRCYVAEGLVKELRGYQRLREDHIRSMSMYINHMQKALIEMNIRLPEVLSQIQGASGLAMIDAILSGVRDPHQLVSLCHSSLIKNKGEELVKALEGFYTQIGLFSLGQALEGYKFYKKQIQNCDAKIGEVLNEYHDTLPENPSKQPRKPIRHNKPDVKGLDQYLLKIFDGKDATALSGITDYNWLQIYTETGADLSRWPSEKHFTSWLGLSPGQNNSGKRQKSKSKGRPKAGHLFRVTAQSLLQSKHIALGAFGRRLRARKGPSIAIKAVARKLAEQYWRLMVRGKEYVEKGVEHYIQQLNHQKMRQLQKLAIELEVELIA
ncbi:IS110 family transposase [Algoriphagus jejuensis]